MRMKTITIILITLFLAGCTFSVSTLPTPTSPPPTLELIPADTTLPSVEPTKTFIPVSTETLTLVPPETVSPVGMNICSDPVVITLIDSLKQSILNADGSLLSSLVSPNGMEVRYFRDGNIVNYLPSQAQFLFETTFEVDWGNEPGSGLEKKGSFHDVIVPDLAKLFNQPYNLTCNELRHGGATYEPIWPYNKDFYSIYFPGTDANGQLDWHTWAVGVEYVEDKPLIYALVNYFWEP